MIKRRKTKNLIGREYSEKMTDQILYFSFEGIYFMNVAFSLVAI